MKTRSIEVDDDTAAALELDRRWKAFEAQESAAASDDVVRWLQTWGTPAFRSWRKTSGHRQAAPNTPPSS